GYGACRRRRSYGGREHRDEADLRRLETGRRSVRCRLRGQHLRRADRASRISARARSGALRWARRARPTDAPRRRGCPEDARLTALRPAVYERLEHLPTALAASLPAMRLPAGVVLCPPDYFDVVDVKNPFMAGN